MDMLINILIGGVGFFVAGFAVAYIFATLHLRHEFEQVEVGRWYTIRTQDNQIDELEKVQQDLRDRLATELWRNRRLERQDKGVTDDMAQWRIGEIQRQINEWEKL